MDINNFTSLPHNVLDDLYEKPEKLEVYSFEDFLKLPLNDLYLEKNGEYNPKEDLKPEPKSESESDSTYDGFYTQSIKAAKKKDNKPREYFNERFSLEKPTSRKNSIEFLHDEPSLGINLNPDLPNKPSASR